MNLLSQRVIGLYILKRFAVNTCMALGGLLAVLMLFDLLANAKDVTTENEAVLFPLIFYLKLRIPIILTLIFPLGIMIAAILTYSKMASQQEIVALRAAGMTISRLTAILALAALSFAFVMFLFNELIVNDSRQKLENWQAKKYTGLPDISAPSETANWIAYENDIIHLESASKDGTTLYNIVLTIRSTDDRLMTHYYRAERADYTDKGWLLSNVVHKNLLTGQEERLNTWLYEAKLAPQQIFNTSKDIESFNVLRLWGLSRHQTGTEAYPAHYYGLWLQRKFAQPLGAIVMILLAAPLAFMMSRRQSLIFQAIISIGAGFLFFVTERVLLTLGESGYMPGILAVWSPIVIFSLLATSFLMYRQS